MSIQLPAPLDKLEGLESVPPEKVRALEERLAATVLPKVRKQHREEAARAQEIRGVILD